MKNRYFVDGNICTLVVEFKDSRFFVEFSTSKLDKVTAYNNWYLLRAKNGKLYVYTRDKARKTVYLHRVVTSAPDGYDVDHKDGDTLNNVDKNLRVVTHKENMDNRGANKNNKCGIRGVCWDKKHNGWKAHHRGKRIGVFQSTEEAVIALEKYKEGLVS